MTFVLSQQWYRGSFRFWHKGGRVPIWADPATRVGLGSQRVEERAGRRDRDFTHRD